MRTTFMIFLLLVSGFIYPQITITHSDYVEAWKTGNNHVNFATPLGDQVTVFVGSKSDAAQTWDFSGYTNTKVGTIIGIEPNTAPVILEFPNSNSVLYSKSYPTGDTIYAWQYQRIDTDRLLLYGVSDETSATITYDPPVLQALIPLNYGMTWVTQRDSVTLVPPNYTIIETTATVDAFGKLKIPSGEFDCLRITLERIGITHTPFSIDTSRSRSYHFYTKKLVELNIQGVTEAQFNETTIDVAGFNFSVPDNSGFIGENGLNSNSYFLFPNYPNPFNHSTKISYNIPEKNLVTIKVCDLLGKEVKILVNEIKPAGQHEVTLNGDELNSGFYFCQFKSGSFIQNRKILVNK